MNGTVKYRPGDVIDSTHRYIGKPTRRNVKKAVAAFCEPHPVLEIKNHQFEWIYVKVRVYAQVVYVAFQNDGALTYAADHDHFAKEAFEEFSHDSPYPLLSRRDRADD